MEIRDFVDQRLRQFLQQRAAEFAEQGAVAVSWRSYRGRRLGPYFRLAWRDSHGRQRSRYLGSDRAVAAEIERWLIALRGPLKTRRRLAKAGHTLRRAVRQQRGLLRRELAALGLSLKGAEVRGWRHARSPEAVDADLATGKSADQQIKLTKTDIIDGAH